MRDRRIPLALVLVFKALMQSVWTCHAQQARPEIQITTPSGPVDSCYVRIQGTHSGVVGPMWP